MSRSASRRAALLHVVYPGQDQGERSSVYPAVWPAPSSLKTLNVRKNRRFGKQVARMRRELRKELVHAAGCTFRFEPAICATRQTEASDWAGTFRVSVPRSLRAKLGRWVGGDR